MLLLFLLLLSFLLLINTRWKELWLERLQNAFHPFTHAWLAHQTRDDYWKHGSVCEDYSLMRCPILLVGGWSDMYTETIFRMAEHHKGPLKCICGPWDHSYPDESLMGPRIDFLRECLRWWDHHLKRVPNDVMDEPKLRLYMEDGACTYEFFLTSLLTFCFISTRALVSYRAIK